MKTKEVDEVIEVKWKEESETLESTNEIIMGIYVITKLPETPFKEHEEAETNKKKSVPPTHK